MSCRWFYTCQIILKIYRIEMWAWFQLILVNENTFFLSNLCYFHKNIDCVLSYFLNLRFLCFYFIPKVLSRYMWPPKKKKVGTWTLYIYLTGIVIKCISGTFTLCSRYPNTHCQIAMCDIRVTDMYDVKGNNIWRQGNRIITRAKRKGSSWVIKTTTSFVLFCTTGRYGSSCHWC